MKKSDEVPYKQGTSLFPKHELPLPGTLLFYSHADVKPEASLH